MKRAIKIGLLVLCLGGIGWAVWAQNNDVPQAQEEQTEPTDQLVEELGQLEEQLTKAKDEEVLQATPEVAETVDKVSKDLSAVKTKIEAEQKINRREQSLNETIFKYGLPIIIAFILILTALNMAPRMLAILMKQPVSGHDNESEMLYTITVFLVIISVLVLGSRGIVDGQNLSTLLAAIVSFVLGQMSKEKAKKGTKDE